MSDEQYSGPDRRAFTHSEVLMHKVESLTASVGEINSTMKELASAVNKLALIEERQSQLAQAVERAFKAIEKVEIAIAELKAQAPITRQTSKWVEHAMTAIVALVGAAVAHKMGLL